MTRTFRAERAEAAAWKLLGKQVPQTVDCILQLVAPVRTRIQLDLTTSRRVQRLVFATLGGFLGLMNVGFWFAFVLANHPSAQAKWGGLGAIVVSLLAGTAAYKVYCLTGGWDRFVNSLYDQVAARTGMKIQVEQMVGRAPDRSQAQALTLAGFIGLLTPLLPEFRAAKFVLLAVLLVVGLSLIVLRAGSKSGAAINRLGAGVVVFLSATIVILYGAATLSFPVAEAIIKASPHGVQTADELCITKRLVVMFLLFFFALGVGVPLLRYPRAVLILVKHMDFLRAHHEVAERVTWEENRAFRFFLIAVWIMLGILLLLTAGVGCSIFEWAVCGTNYLLPLPVAKRFAEGWSAVGTSMIEGVGASTETGRRVVRALLLLYGLPLAMWTAFVLWRNLREVYEYFRLRFGSRQKPESRNRQIQVILEEICAFAETRPPIIAIRESNTIDAFVYVPNIPGTREILLLTRGAMERLAPDELAAIVAHEIGHIHHEHTSILAILRVLSRWSLLGEGFLVGLLEQPEKLEMEADQFAVTWLERRDRSGKGRRSLLEALDALEQQSIGAVRQAMVMRNRVLPIANPGDWLPVDLRHMVDEYQRANLVRKASTLLRIFEFLYFEGGFTNCFHPSYQARRRYIQDLPPCARARSHL